MFVVFSEANINLLWLLFLSWTFCYYGKYEKLSIYKMTAFPPFCLTCITLLTASKGKSKSTDFNNIILINSRLWRSWQFFRKRLWQALSQYAFKCIFTNQDNKWNKCTKTRKKLMNDPSTILMLQKNVGGFILYSRIITPSCP